MRPRFVSLLLNGTKLVRCDVPEGDEECSVSVPLSDYDPPEAKMEAHGDTQVGYKFSCVMSIPSSGTSGPSAAAGTDAFALCDAGAYEQWEGTLLLDSEVVGLGWVSRERLVSHSVAVVPCRPQWGKLVVTKRLDTASGDPGSVSGAAMAQKSKLLVCVREALADDKINPRQGSLPAALIEEKARACDCFHDVVRMYERGFIGFIESHSDDFTLFNYTQDEIEGRDMEEHAHTKELRIVLKKGKRVQFCSEAEEHELLDLLKEVLSEGDLTCDELLLRIHEAGVGFSISPCFSQLMRFLSRNTDLFSWSTDPSQITTVSFSGTSMKEQPQKRQQETVREHKHPGSTKHRHSKHACIHPVNHGTAPFRGSSSGSR
eukprot:TRINITY_DN10643_c1_g2_i2.p1 TRINITY_DN10643_c1_g2~~TRINITY_DN10643_c1_g2_i2.p1  ORF type:complete len:390 (+),score=127.90 TRINITY_DN10643_c1_g2_i2:49-1170(+)